MTKPSSILPADPAYDEATHLAYVQKLHATYALNSEAKVDAFMTQLLHRIADAHVPWRILEELGDSVHALLTDNGVFMPRKPTFAYRPALVRQQAILSSPSWHRLVADEVAELYTSILSCLPPSVFEKDGSGFVVPLHDLIPNLPELILHIVHVSGKERDGLSLLERLNTQLIANTITASGYDLDTYDSKPLVYPTESALPPRLLVDAYLRDTPFHELFTASVPLSIPRALWNEHAFICAGTGHGKSQTLGHLVHTFLNEPDPPGMFIMAGIGQMHALIQELACVDRIRDRLLVIDPEVRIPELNFFDLGIPMESTQAVDLFRYLFTALDREFTGKQSGAVPYVLRMMSKIEGANLLTLLKLMSDRSKTLEQSEFAEPASRLDPLSRSFFETQFYDREMLATRQQIASRLFSLFANETFAAMFNAPRSEFNALDAMQQKKIVLINTSDAMLGEASPILGRFVIAQIFAALIRRPKEHRPQCVFIVDEFKQYADDRTERFLSQARQFQCGLVMATQFIGQLPDEVKDAILANTSIKMAGPVSHKDATVLAKEMYTEPEFIRSMRKHADRSEFACHLRNLTPNAIRVSIPFGTLENSPRSTQPASVEPVVPPPLPAAVSPRPHDPRTPPPLPDPAPSSPNAADAFEVKPGKDWTSTD